MFHIRSKDTSIEMMVRRLFVRWDTGTGFNYKALPGKLEDELGENQIVRLSSLGLHKNLSPYNAYKQGN